MPAQTPTGTPAQNPATARADFLAALRNTFRSPDGAVVLTWLHAAAATRKPCFVSGSAGTGIDPYLAAVRDGRKGLVWEIEANLLAAESDTPDKPPTRPRSRAR